MNKNENKENEMSDRCQYQVVVYFDAQGVDLCESLDLPEYPSYQCHGAARDHSEMCKEHDAYSSHYDMD